MVFGVWTTIIDFNLKLGLVQIKLGEDDAWVLLISCTYEDHITFVAINTHTKLQSRMYGEVTPLSSRTPRASQKLIKLLSIFFQE